MNKLLAAGMLLLSSTIGATAAPFCLVIPGTKPMCMYYDGAACSRDAIRQNGGCEPNAAETHIPSSRNGNYCVVVSTGDGSTSTCGYADPILCANVALGQHGICATSEGTGPSQLPNAYFPNANR